MMTPGPDHPITVEPGRTRWRAMFNDAVIADSDDALVLREADYPAVVYFPRDSVAMEYMARTDRVTHCPYKGDATYYTIRRNSEIAENVAWSYEDPADTVGQIAGRIAFYTDQVEVYPVDDAAVNPHHHDRSAARDEMMDRSEVDEIIQHTDSGSGVSQKDHWEPNVETPGDEQGGLR
ncbi:DUF427 domain-containing protein [Phenylobacterium sp.]|uniref:DUF427 domain-containing protein n=1 Tax=Phenylobacterium sp. TaxID=1871053 RepID=UPI0035B4D958